MINYASQRLQLTWIYNNLSDYVTEYQILYENAQLPDHLFFKIDKKWVFYVTFYPETFTYSKMFFLKLI